MQISIDQEFKNLIPPLSEEEYHQLEQNIIRDGCREPLVVWGDVIVDGHNRYAICCQHSVKFETHQMEFSSRDAVMDWIDSNQLGRRNLSPDQMSLIRGRRYNRLKKQGARTDLTSRQNDGKSQSTAQKIANDHGVSERTIERDGQFATNIETLKPFVPEVEQMVTSGEVTKSAINEAAKDPERAVTTLATLHTGDEESYTPIKYIESARAVMDKIDLDPASNTMAQENIMADKYYTVNDNGLEQDWSGRVWLNPPYTARVINKFIDKTVQHFLSGEITEAIVLTNNNTDTSWFHNAAKTASAICFTAGRINFLKRDGSTSSPTNGQSFFYFGKNLNKFIEEFSKHGLCMVKI